MDLATMLGIDNLSEYKFHAARYNQHHKPLDVFVKDKGVWDSWNAYRGNKNDFNRKYIISFIQFYHEYETWLFGGVYEVLGGGHEIGEHSYDIRKTEIGADLIGRLKINLSLARGRAFIFKNIYDKITITEVLKEPYTGQSFPGYENIDLDFSQFEGFYNKQREDWKTALQNVKGIYLITDKKNGKKYVGSAYGEFGIWSRWGVYVTNAHGGNKKLYALIDEVGGKEYARENFKLTLLECWPFKTDDQNILTRESFWKEALMTRGKYGYNAN